MSDDIVTRLRNNVVEKPEFIREGSTEHLLSSAADEIERLRAGFQLMAKAYAADLGMDRHGWDADRMCEEFLRKAAHGG